MHHETPTYLLLGPVMAVDTEGSPLDLGGAQRRAVLAQMVLGLGRVVSMDALSEGIWGDRPPPTAMKSLQVHISRLRAVLPTGDLVTCAPGYVLRAPNDASDIACFEARVARARGAMGAGKLELAADLLRSALGFWRGPTLADVADLPFAAAAVARLEEARQQALQDRIAADLSLGRHASVVGELEVLVRAHPLRELLWGQLMTALYHCERQAEALDAFSRARRHLVEELGLEPGPELRRLESEILNQTLVPPTPAPVGGPMLQGPKPMPPHRRPSSSLRPSGPVVGREGALARLRAALDDVAANHVGGIVVVLGDEGMGKTSLIAAFSELVSARALVVDGRCREHLMLPFGPWAEILQQLGADQVVSDSDPDADGATPDRRRVQLFDWVVSCLQAESRRQPVVVVLDDLHWSDDASITLLLHAVEELASSEVLFIAAWRDREIALGHPVTRLVHQVARKRTIALDLAPLAPPDILELLRLSELSGEVNRMGAVASMIHGITSGVPLFVAEVVSTLSDEYDELPDADDIAPGIPETVRSLVAHRLTQAGPVVGIVAEACTVLSEPFQPAVVHALVPLLHATEVLLALDALVDAGLIREEALGYSFVHATFRRAIDFSVRSGRRQLLHAAAYLALEHQQVPPAVLVHHSDAAGPLVASADALRQLHRAGTDAVERGAFVDAAEFFGRAVERTPEAERAPVLVSHADALWRAGDITAAKAVAAGVVARAGDPSVSDRTLTDSVVLHGTFGDGFGVDHTSIAATEMALAVVTDPEQRARLMIARAYHHATWGSPVSVALEAVERAMASLPDPCPAEVLSEAVFAESLALFGTPDLGRRRRLANDLVALARQNGSDRDLGRGLRMRSLVEMSEGRLLEVTATLTELFEVAERAGSWMHRSDAWRWRITVALAAGDDVRAAADLDALEQISARQLAGRGLVGTQRMLVHLLRGELGPCLTLLDSIRSALPVDRARAPDRNLAELFRLVVLVKMGQVEKAREGFVRLWPQLDLGLSSCRRYPAELVLTAELVTAFAMGGVAGPLIERLAPFAGQLLVLAWGDAILGAADRYLAGLRSLVTGRVDDAGFARAVDLEEAAGARGEADRTRLAWRRAAAFTSSEVAR